jgi:hypothetical protein
MFAAPTAAARSYTFPVVVSFQQWDGFVDAGVGTFVVVNDDGWIATAAHLFEIGQRMLVDKPAVEALRQEIVAVDGNMSIPSAQRARQVKKLKAKANPKWLVRDSYWWAADGVTLQDVQINPALDLAVGRLDPFPQGPFKGHAVIKNPAQGLDQGTSLCRLGFPFPQISATYDDAANSFRFDSSGLTYFPLDGIFTRTLVEPPTPGANVSPMWIETSSPGLRGQSGGPVYDSHGRVWGIQSSTKSIPLGFDPEITVQGKKVKEHQFVNLGIALHPQCLVDALTAFGVRFDLSPD